VTVEMTIAERGVTGASFYRSVIRSDERLDYDRVDRIFAGRDVTGSKVFGERAHAETLVIAMAAGTYRNRGDGRAAAVRQVMQAAPSVLGLTDLLRFRFGRGVRAGVDMRRPTHTREGQAGQQGRESTKEARSLGHLVNFTPRTLILTSMHADTYFDARRVPAGGNPA